MSSCSVPGAKQVLSVRMSAVPIALLPVAEDWLSLELRVKCVCVWMFQMERKQTSPWTSMKTSTSSQVLLNSTSGTCRSPSSRMTHIHASSRLPVSHTLCISPLDNEPDIQFQLFPIFHLLLFIKKAEFIKSKRYFLCCAHRTAWILHLCVCVMSQWQNCQNFFFKHIVVNKSFVFI